MKSSLGCDERLQCPSRRQKTTSHDGNAFMVFLYLSTIFKYLKATNFIGFFSLLLNNEQEISVDITNIFLDVSIVCSFNLDLIQIFTTQQHDPPWNISDDSSLKLSHCSTREQINGQTNQILKVMLAANKMVET